MFVLLYAGETNPRLVSSHARHSLVRAGIDPCPRLLLVMEQADLTQISKAEPGAASSNSKKTETKGDGSTSAKNTKQTQGTRKRVSQACDKCRSRKDKCDGKRPTCSTCLTHGRTCSYDANVKKRGLPEGYVRGIEKLWGLTIREVDGVENEILSIFTGDESNETLINVWRNEDGQPDSLAEVWRKSQLAKELERLLPILEPGPNSDAGKRKRLDSDAQLGKRPGSNGPPSDSPASNFEHDSQSQMVDWSDRKLDFRIPGEVGGASAFGGSVPNLSNSEQTLKSHYGSILSPAYIPNAKDTNIRPPLPELPSEAWHLLDVYFSYTHCWLPIVEKGDLLRISYHYAQVRNDEMAGHSGNHALLWAAIAYAKFQHRAINNIPHAQGPVSQAVWTAERMYTHARALIPNEEEAFDLGHVQALLILTLANLGLGHFNRAWILIGTAVRVAIELGLDTPFPDDTTSTKQNSRNKHVFLGCFVLDTIVAARLKRRPHLRTNDLDCVGTLIEDGLEEWDPWTDCLLVRRSTTGNPRVPASILSTFNRLIQVLQILNDASCASESTKTVQFSTGLLDRLHAWSRAQSQPLYLDSSAMNSEQASSLLPHHYHLHIAYFTTFAACQLLSHGKRKESPDLEPCTRSARQIVHLLKRHSYSFGLLIIPPTLEYFTKTAYDVVHAVRRSIENTHIVLDDWKYSLDTCVSSMEPAWPVFEHFKTASENAQHWKNRRESQVAFDLINGIIPTAETPQSAKTPNSATSYEMSQPYSPQVFRSQSMNSIDVARPNRNTLQYTKNLVPPTSYSNQSFNAPGADNFSATIPESPQSVFNLANPSNLTPWTLSQQNQNRSTNQLPLALGQALQSPQVQRAVPPGIETDGDSIFNDFAVMDAMEWTNSMDQSLVNLGFEDPEKRNQDFYAFCREPDPLYSNNTVFQQLLASSNAESSSLFAAQGFGNAGLPMASESVLGGGMDYGGDEGIEAGQILQALSTHKEQRKNSGNG
ncbi:C6 transcription factor protein [Rutstroemia sp. NJR-2017a BVV2]|nr:C6 transcription factor protein [Rutstroemia sp. NJR-2017a BVV2]